VEGESGVGKSELCAEFLRGVEAREPQLITLHGRCYENEQVAYKAFDGCIDELARVLRGMDERASAALLPPRATLLGQLFPVLRDIGAIAKAPRTNLSADPTARRLEAFTALAGLLAKLAEDRPVVLVIDDLQWADAESFRLLQALLQQAEPPPVLIVATIRPHQELDADVVASLEAVGRLKHFQVVKLIGLPMAHAQALAGKLLGPRAPERWLRVIAEESQGHPLLLQELVQFTLSYDFGSRSLTLEAALRARIERLDEAARELLEVVALAGRPYGSHIFARALSVDDVDVPARSVLATKLVRLRRGHELGCYHDRIRHAAVSMIARSRLTPLHRQLAEALASDPESDVSEQARHWDLASEVERASAAYELASERALEALAFTRSAELCARAMELLGAVPSERLQRLTIRRAHALSCVGRSMEAAALYQLAADRAEGEARIKLRSRHAQQLMIGAKIAQGYGAARKLLRDLGISTPLGLAGWLARFGWDTLWLALRGDRITERQSGASDDGRRVKLEVLDELRYVVACLHPAVYVLLTLQRMRLSAGSRSAVDVAQAYASRGWMRTVSKSLAAALPLFEMSRKLLPPDSDPVMLATRAHVEGSARLAGWDFAGGIGYLLEAQRLLQERCPEQPWLLTLVRYHLGLAWYHLGEHSRISAEVETWMKEARERNDVLTLALLMGMGHGFLRHLMLDSPKRALDALDGSIQSLPSEPYSFAHFGNMIGTVMSLLYQGGAGALHWLDAHEAEHKKIFLLKTRMGRDALLLYRGLATLRALGETSVSEQPALIAKERKVIKALMRGSEFTRASGLSLAGQLDELEGNHERALLQLREALALFEAMKHSAVRPTRFLIGVLEGGQSGRELCDATLAFYRGQGWREPLGLLNIALPALSTIMARKVRTKAAHSRLVLDRYEVVRSLGSGGFGSVVEALDVQTGRSVALKELIRDSGMPLERFKREFRALQSIHHGNVLRLEALIEHEATWYIVMELVEGENLLDYVRPQGALDLERLRTTFAGLAEGLLALHAAGFVHRDIKPENVRVTGSGRAVLLDFGLIARPDGSHEQAPVGSVEYAAPEQLEGAQPSASADVYALGSCLYQALSGRLPFSGDTPAQLLHRKQKWRPRAIVDSGSEALAALALRALAVAPKERPTLDELAAALGGSKQNLEAALEWTRLKAERDVPFAGREQELAALSQAFDGTCDSGCTVALVEGESGLGKSALVGEFGRRLVANYPNLLLLQSRCYENEQVSFKAFDGAVDQLAELLRSLPNPSCEALLPRRAALLGQLFPVLTSVDTIEQAPKKGLPAEPSARKLLALECFIELLTNLSAHYELLFTVDDLQWADSDSFALLRKLSERQLALPVMFVCTVRPASELESSTDAALAQLRALDNTVVLELSGLSDAAAQAFVTELFGEELPESRLRRLLDESRGHPLFLRELVEQAKSGEHPSSPLTLDQALRVRIESFDGTARSLLSLAALAVRPYGLHVFARALKVREIPSLSLVALIGRGLLARRGDGLTCYHDRIRHVALSLLDGEQRRALAHALAEALELESTADPAERARLWDEAGDATKAATAYEEAGDRALEGLTFAGAERHYARALELLGTADEAHAGRLDMQRGQSLARAGRSAEAATVFQRAATRAEGETQVRLRIWAAQHLIQSAQVEQGLSAAATLLAELGISLPTSERAARFRLGWEHARSRAAGRKLKPRTRAMPQRERLVLEALHGLSSPVRAVSYLPGLTLIAQYLRRALAAGEPIHTARALAYDALGRSTRSPNIALAPLFEQSRMLSADTPAVLAEVDLVWGFACLSRSDFEGAAQRLSLAHDLLSARCPGEPWLLTSARMYLGSTWGHAGSFATLARHAGGWLDEARSRDDRYAYAALAGFGLASVRHLLRDDPAALHAELDEAMAPWAEQVFTINHFGAMICRAFALMYGGGSAALDWIDSVAPTVEHCSLMKTPACRGWLGSLRVVACISAANAAEGAARQALLQRAERELKPVERMKMPLTPGFVDLVRAVLAVHRGRTTDALALARESVVKLSQQQHYVRHGAEYVCGLLEGGESGRARCGAVLDHVRSEGWVDPERALGIYAPLRSLPGV